jgi:hypothetical protein
MHWLCLCFLSGPESRNREFARAVCAVLKLADCRNSPAPRTATLGVYQCIAARNSFGWRRNVVSQTCALRILESRSERAVL